MLIQHGLVADIRSVPAAIDLVVLPPLCPLTVPPIDFGHTPELIERSRQNAEQFLDRLPSSHDGHAVPESLRTAAHVHALPS